MYAIIEIGGHQWKVAPGTRLDVNRIPAEVGTTQAVGRVLLAGTDGEVKIGRPYVEGAQVVCEVVEHRRGPKVVSYHFRRRENWRKTVGHRQSLTRLLVKDIVLPNGAHGSAKAAPAAAHPTKAGKAPAVARKSPIIARAKKSLAPKKRTGSKER